MSGSTLGKKMGKENSDVSAHRRCRADVTRIGPAMDPPLFKMAAPTYVMHEATHAA